MVSLLKWLSVRLQTKWLWVRVPLQSFTYSVCGPFTKNKERIQKIKKTRNSRYIYQNKLDKTCFQQDMAYGDVKNLPRKTASEKVLHDKAFNIAKNVNYDRYPIGLASMVISDTSDIAVKSEIMSNQKLSEELQKAIIKKFEKRKVNLSFIDNIWGADLAYMQFVSKLNKGILFFIMCY